MVFRFCPGSELSAEMSMTLTSFLDSQSSAHPFQCPDWAPLGSVLGNRAYCCWLEDGMNVRAFARANVIYPASRLLPGVRALVVNGGPVCDDPEIAVGFLSQLVAAARELGFVYLEASSEWLGTAGSRMQDWFEHGGWARQGSFRTTLRLDLNSDCATLVAAFQKTTRYEIRRAEKTGVTVWAARDRRDCERFYDLLQRMAAEKCFAVESRSGVVHVWNWLASDPRRGVLLLASHQNAARGGVMVVRAGRRAWYVRGASQKQLPYSVGHLLQWRAIQWAKENGCTEYDFGGYTVGATTGPAYFKRGFCDRVVQFLPAYRYVLNDSRYERCLTWMRWRKGTASAAVAAASEGAP